MPLFLGTWKIMDSQKVPCMTYFGSMSKADDEAESPGVNLLGRWSDMNNATGTFVCEADDYTNIASWLYNWAPMASCDVKPICDDNTARRIILKKEPSYTVDYSHVGDEPFEGETLFAINYKFKSDSKVAGNQAFANLTEEQDNQDSGNCRPLGRWHDIANGTGFAIAAAKSEADVYAWAYNWAPLCDCTIRPCLTDTQCRKIISGKPNFQTNLAKVQESMSA